ncbi:hypothetical protein KP509_37G042500 [Ceratopteris richardii]|uniref:RZ-type domain-containing protein n=1 Tax=Ceratopteris richardii TaxID=49495 RepID=A0A8T2Q820_CERRI|nr:hypothetical protein KP509_37G042500 [Ceratopteris richardii]
MLNADEGSRIDAMEADEKVQPNPATHKCSGDECGLMLSSSEARQLHRGSSASEVLHGNMPNADVCLRTQPPELTSYVSTEVRVTSVGPSEVLASNAHHSQESCYAEEIPCRETLIDDEVAAEKQTSHSIISDSGKESSTATEAVNVPTRSETDQLEPMDDESITREIEECGEHSDILDKSSFGTEVSYRDVLADGKDGDINFYLLVSPHPKSVKASFDSKYCSKLPVQHLRLPESVIPFVGNYTCCRICIPSSYWRRRIHVKVTFAKYKVLNFPLPYIQPEKNMEVLIRRRNLQIEIVHEETITNLSNWILAFNSIVVLLNNPSVRMDCLFEFVHHKRKMSLGDVTNAVAHKMTHEWLCWVDKEIRGHAMGEGLNEGQVSNMLHVLLGQFYVVSHLEQRAGFVDLSDEYSVRLLQLLSDVWSHRDLLKPLLSRVVSFMQQSLSTLVSLLPAAKWSLYLEVLCGIDTSYSFLDKWTGKLRSGSMSLIKEYIEKDHDVAVRNLLGFAETHPGMRYKVLNSAILASSTGASFFKTFIMLCGHLMLPTTATEEGVESFLATGYGEKLIGHFRSLVESESAKTMATLVGEQLQRCDNKVLITFLRIFAVVVLRRQALPHVPHMTTFSCTDSHEARLDDFTGLWTSHHTFMFPLLSDEKMFMHDLASCGNFDTIAYAIRALVGKNYSCQDDLDGRISAELRPWIHKVCTRAADAARKNIASRPMSPHVLCSAVAKLFGKSLHSVGPLLELVNDDIRCLLQQRFGLQELCQDAGNMSSFSEIEVAQQYCSVTKMALLEYVRSAERFNDSNLDATCLKVLDWMCTGVQEHMKLCGWIAEELCICLFDAFTGICESDLSASNVALAESNFKIFLLQVDFESAPSVRMHVFYRCLMAEWCTLQDSLEKESILLEMVDKLSHHSMDAWVRVCNVHEVGSKALKEAVDEVVLYTGTILNLFRMLLDYARTASGSKFIPVEIQMAEAWLEERCNSWKSLTLSDIRDPAHWPLRCDKNLSQAMLLLRESKLHRNIYKVQSTSHIPHASTDDGFSGVHCNVSGVLHESSVDQEDNDCDMNDGVEDEDESQDFNQNNSLFWQNLFTTMCSSLTRYEQEWKHLANLSYPAEKLCNLLSGLNQNDVKSEIMLAQSFFGCRVEHKSLDFQPACEALTAWIDLQEKKSLIQPLVTVEDMFGIIESGGLLLDLQTVCDASLLVSLQEFQALYEKNINAIRYFSSNHISIIKELACSEQLLSFVKENSDDLRLLTDAAEESAEDVLVDEATISYLIHIDRVFRPLLKRERISLADLKSALALEAESTDSAMSFCSKIRYCMANIYRIQQVIASLADRSSVLKVNMHSIVHSSIFSISISTDGENLRESNSFSLKIKDSALNSNHIVNSQQSCRKSFDLSELIDLKSRAQMLLSRKILTHEKESNEMKPLREFIEFVDLCEELCNLVSTSCKAGHFLFDAFRWSGSGSECLKVKVQWIKSHLFCWNRALERARFQFHNLNHFKGTELRLIHRRVNGEADLDEIQRCYELLKYSRPGLNSERVETCSKGCICTNSTKRVIDLEANEIQMFECLQYMSSILQDLFEVPCCKTLNGNVDMFQVVDSIFLISVEEQSHQLNVIVEILSRNNKELRNQHNNLLLCSSKTSWEEVYLLLLRYLSPSDGDVCLFFVIAFFEKLSFECQMQLLTKLQEAENHQKVTNQLALVCWTGSQALQGISHHLKVPIQFMNGYANDIILQYLPRECGQMTVVTSELAGMGKSSVIKNNPFCITFTISQKVSLESLILRLKKKRIMPESTLHFDIATEEGCDSLNCYLFQLLVLGVLKSSDGGAVWLVTEKVYIELANTLGNSLEAKLPVCSWLPHEHLVWNLDKLHLSNDVDSDEQIVCLYLDALSNNELDRRDIIISGNNMNVEPLSEDCCRQLLFRYFIQSETHLSYSIVAGFIRNLAFQLRKFSDSDLYSIETLCWILQSSTPGNFRSNLVSCLIQSCKELSLRSVRAWLHSEQQEAVHKHRSRALQERMRSLVAWSDSNHVMFFVDKYGVFNVLYRDKELIPGDIKRVMLIQTQVMRTELLDYSKLASSDLWRILSPILGRDIPSFSENYVLTPDNFLKMALIFVRISTQSPVIIMGETGCGKTCLLKALARCSNAEFSCLTLHAGSTEGEIASFISDARDQALSSDRQVWAFLDEINACNHLGFLSEILCHRRMDGNVFPSNLAVLAACNPYRHQDIENRTAGLQSSHETQSSQRWMAYKVQPLPEAMLDYVWDYGILSDGDEREYICAMIGTRGTDIVEILSNSQAFMRKHMGLSSVSLRDVQRWIHLFDWFKHNVAERMKLQERTRREDTELRAKVLACSLCYYCRLPTKALRKAYRTTCCKFLTWRVQRNLSEKDFLNILHQEQHDILARMDMPSGIAMNSSLLENVFVVLTCMLNHLPVFVVGKPGSGKTLALQIIFSNLRGPDSKDRYFQQLPRMLMLSYQGSQNSTSEAISKVFEKAKRYVENTTRKDTVVVLVLDEIGLAETSSHNPLKVLHPLLEPDVQDIAVVGISNWSLDAAKMNRGVHLSQSDPEETDLYKTAMAIFESCNTLYIDQFKKILRGLATAYFKYYAQQIRPDFHGLRDFYSLIRSLRCQHSVMLSQEHLAHALWRNFGGVEMAHVQSFFSDVEALTCYEGLFCQGPPVLDLITRNLHDPEARHLLLITKGGSASSILKHMLEQDEDFTVIQGSTYKDDKSEEYCHLLLGEIILHMEMGRRILLENADQIWSSLYDMLNQHYTVVGGRKNCRIALGMHSNPMCYVHDRFRCIIIVEHSQIPRMDPPFLNRFEKQVLTYETILDGIQIKIVESIRCWAHELAVRSLIPGTLSKLNDAEGHLFSGFYDDTVPSLVMYHSNEMGRETSDHSELIKRCKEDLLQTANAEAIARAQLYGSSKEEETRIWAQLFFSCDALHSLDEAIRFHVCRTERWFDNIGVKLIITTCTPVQWNIKQDIESSATSLELKVFCLRLADFTSEKQLKENINRFWSDTVMNLLVLQADDVSDRDHISLASFYVDKARKTMDSELAVIKKHVILIIHVQQGRIRCSRTSFLCGWKQMTINRLQREPIHLRVYLEKSISEIIAHHAMPMKGIMTRALTWSFLCIKFEERSLSVSYLQKTLALICKDEALIFCLKERALEWVLKRKDNLWQLNVLSNRKLLSTSASTHDAFVQYIEEEFREALARLLYLIEKSSSLNAYFLYDDVKQQIWRELLMRPNFLSCDSAATPSYPGGYILEKPMMSQLPFSSCYAAHLDKTFKQIYMESLSKDLTLEVRELNECICTSNQIQKDVDASLNASLSIIKACIDADLDSYVTDFCRINNLNRSGTITEAFEWALRENLPPHICCALHVHVVFWEREREIRDQASLASLCLSYQVINQQICDMRAGRPPNEGFNEFLDLICCSYLLPTENNLNNVGGIKKWTQKVKAVLKSEHTSGVSCMVFLLWIMYTFTVCVILPLQLECVHLISLAECFAGESERACASIVVKVMDFLPDLKTSQNHHERRCWIDFLCSMLNRYLQTAWFSKKELRRILFCLVNSQSTSCMIGHVLFQLLNKTVNSVPEQHSQIFKTLSSMSRHELFNDEWGIAINHANALHLVDYIYHEFREIMVPVLLDSKEAGDWEFSSFRKCFSFALQASGDVNSFSFQKATALAFMKCFLYSLASLLHHAYSNRGQDENQMQLPSLLNLNEVFLAISSNLLNILQVSFMKILYWDFRLAVDDIADALNYFESKAEFDFFTLLLDNPILRSLHMPLGFNPFMSSSGPYITAEQVWKNLVCMMKEEGSKYSRKIDNNALNYFFNNANEEEQSAFIGTIASQVFFMKSGCHLSTAEQRAMEHVQKLVSHLNNWDPLMKMSVTHLTSMIPGGKWWSAWSSFESCSLALNILVTLSLMPSSSPLRGYCMLNKSHLTKGCMLTEAQNILDGVEGLGQYLVYTCSCSYAYIIGECTKPAQVGICPSCGKQIGGENHVAAPGNQILQDVSNGCESLIGNIFFSLRMQPLSYRILRVLVHYCFLLGIMMDRDTAKLASLLKSPNDIHNLVHILVKSIGLDIELLGQLIGCPRDVTFQYLHSILQRLTDFRLDGPLCSPQQRDQWEMVFDNIVTSQLPYESISEYLQCKQTDCLHDVLQERNPCSADLLESSFRITVKPSFSQYRAYYLQKKQLSSEFPCINAVLVHAKHLKELRFLLPLIEFSRELHHLIGHKITRQEATSTSIQDILSHQCDLSGRYDTFEASWNAIRHLVKGYECHEFIEPVPPMHKLQPIGLCLLEKKDQGIYLTAILDFLRTCQNAFLEDIRAALLECAPACDYKLFDAVDARNIQSVPIQFCKAGEIVYFDEKWASNLVRQFASCNPAYGKGTEVEYDDYHIEVEMQYRIIHGKSFLLGEYKEFPYQREAFQRHATLISDLTEHVPQALLPSNKVATICNELALEGTGPWQLLVTLELCLGFLNRMKVEPSELLRDYCERWLGSDIHPIMKKEAFDRIEVKHVVSLYESIEAMASSDVEDMVAMCYRSDLDSGMHADLMQMLMVRKNMWRSDDCRQSCSRNIGNVNVEALRDVLKQFMFRYLTVETFNPDDELQIYLRKEGGLVTWPISAEKLESDAGAVVGGPLHEDFLPNCICVKHTRAIYLILKEA